MPRSGNVLAAVSDEDLDVNAINEDAVDTDDAVNVGDDADIANDVAVDVYPDANSIEAAPVDETESLQQYCQRIMYWWDMLANNKWCSA